MTSQHWRSIVWALAMMFAAGAIGGAEQRDRPAANMAPTDVTASVSGVVTLSLTNNEPVRRAVVSLISVDGGDGAATVADDEGRFTIRGVPAGRYSIVAQKPAYLTNSYGAKRPGRPGVSVVVAKGQALADLRIALPKGGVITGRVSLATGQPLRNTQVLAVPMSKATAGGRMDTRGRAFFTDDLGIYRIYGLLPDEYIVAALPSIGRGDVEQRIGAAGVARFGYAPTYYPGTPVPADASTIRVAIGDVKEGVDIATTMFAMSTISGTVVDVNGLPTRAVQLSAETVGPALPLFAGFNIRVNPPDPQGHFTIANVPPGVYKVIARGGGMTISGNTVTTRTADQTDWAIANLQVIGRDIDNMTLSLQKGMTFSGHIAASGSKTPESLSGIRIALAEPGANPASARTTTVGEDGAFSVTGLPPATYDIAITLPSALSSAWAVRSITAGGVELRDRPLTFENGSISDVTIALTDQRTEVAGTLFTPGGSPATDYFIVVFAADRALWHPLSPRVRAVRPNADGGFTARDLPAGNYRIAALTDVEPDEWRRASFLESLWDASVAITVNAGLTTRQDLRIQGTSR